MGNIQEVSKKTEEWKGKPMSKDHSNSLSDDIISKQKTMIENMYAFTYWMQYGIISIFVTLGANTLIVHLLSIYTTLKIDLFFDVEGPYIAFCCGLTVVDVLIGLIALGTSRFDILVNKKLITFLHIVIYIIFLSVLILCSLYISNKAYNYYQNYRQITNQILEKCEYQIDLDEKSMFYKRGFEEKPIGWLYDLEYTKEDSEGQATVKINFDYSPDSITVKKFFMTSDLMEDNRSIEITDLCNLAKQLYPNKTLESLKSQILELVRQYDITQEEQHMSYIDSDTQFSVSVNKAKNENCDYSLVIVIFYIGDGKQSSF